MRCEQSFKIYMLSIEIPRNHQACTAASEKVQRNPWKIIHQFHCRFPLCQREKAGKKNFALSEKWRRRKRGENCWWNFNYILIKISLKLLLNSFTQNFPSERSCRTKEKFEGEKREIRIKQFSSSQFMTLLALLPLSPYQKFAGFSKAN